MRYLLELRQRGEVRYFALKTGRESDFVTDGVAGVEVKETPTLSDRTALEERWQPVPDSSKAPWSGAYPVPAFTGYLWGGRSAIRLALNPFSCDFLSI